ncbi:TonB-dependent receptor [Pedobacter sp. MC2016-24]|uniref:TonB-dependent receptor n=1 Tax=Pedobacter sp. MC2016-24 TaxID=2780090 RepID=UPI00187F5033|nr:TonB-dependent receptor [Pedobacter sp. MC2016-24]MBE9598475.1 TonB-dependent receptor [Pedobacter sp. MC2016-24]
MSRLTFLITVITLTFTGVILASGVKSQNLKAVRLSVNTKGLLLKDILADLEHRSDFNFVLTDEIGAIGNIRLTDQTITLYAILAEIAQQKKLEFSQDGYLIALSKLAIPPKPGHISGKVTDERGEPLPGASIKIIETKQIVQSDPNGRYNISLQPGSYTLEFSYISFQGQRVTGVLVNENKNTPLNIVLKVDSKGLKEVIVTSGYKKASIASLYALQQNTSNLSDGISAEQIGATPDKHVGETLKRITGVSTTDNKKVVVRGIAERYNVSLLNGSTLPSTDVQERDFEFNLIPTSLVEQIVVAKSITADMPYGFAGGLVQITTKSVPNSNFLSISAGTSFNSITTGKDFMGYGRGKYDYLGFDDGTRNHFPKGLYNLGEYNPSLSDEQNTIKAAQIGEQNKRIGGTERLGTRIFQAMPSQNYQLSLGRTYALDTVQQRKIGFVASLSYRNTQNNDDIASMRRGRWSQQPVRGDDPDDINTGNIYGFNTTWGLLVNGGFKTADHQINTYNLYTRIFDNRFSRITGWTHENPKDDLAQKFPSTQEDDRPKFTDLLQNKVSGTHRFNAIKLEWSAARTSLKSLEQDAVAAQLSSREIVNKAPFSGYGPNSASEPGFGEVHRDQYIYQEKNFDATFSAAYDFKVGNTANTFKTGVNYLKKHADYNWGILPISMSSKSTVPINQIPIQEWGNYMGMEDDGHNIFYFPARYSLNAFEAKSVNKGAFMMMDHKLLPNLRVVYGLRADYFRLDTIQNSASLLRDIASKLVFDEAKDWYFMPSANVTYTPVKDLNVRASYAKSAVRPGLMENSRFSRFNPNYGSYVKSSGVSSTIIDNYDAKIEWFPGAGELLSVGYFYKYFDKPAEYYRVDRENNGVGYIIISNSDWAKVKGWEFELRKNLGFISDNAAFLSHVYLSGNLTLQKSSVRARELQTKTLPNKTDSVYYIYQKYPRALYGQVPLLYNAGIQYAGEKLGLNLTYNYAGYKTFITGISPDLIEYERPRAQMDAQISYRFLKGKMETKLNMSNLFNAPFRYFINDASTYEQKPGTENELNLEWNDKYSYKEGFSEKFEAGYTDPETNRKVGDRQSSTRYTGRTFSLSFSYNF